MKSIKLLLTLVLSVSILSCSSDDDASSNLTGSLVGVWAGVDVDYSGETVSSVQGQTLTSDFVGEAYDVDYSLTFTENPDNIVSDGSYSVELTTSFAGQTIVQNVENISFLQTGTWAIDGDELTITDSNESSTATITELTDTSLTITVSTVEDLSEQGITSTSTIDLIATFLRQ